MSAKVSDVAHVVAAIHSDLDLVYFDICFRSILVFPRTIYLHPADFEIYKLVVPTSRSAYSISMVARLAVNHSDRAVGTLYTLVNFGLGWLFTSWDYGRYVWRSLCSVDFWLLGESRNGFSP